ncbi:uncharacterized protein LOC142631891 [Castanea sativa]|uniref:uncharacterized protein LOC142631891 n=1 Tax=Castanea sativa TaxID=21020 RepID=UPI003F64B9C5
MQFNKNADTIKFLCSYGGKILPRYTDGALRYAGGLTRVLSVDRSISFTELMVKLGEFCGSSVNLRCQLPTGDLETLISITSDEDLANVIEEYDRASSSSMNNRPLKIRAVLSPPKSLKQISPPQTPPESLKNSPFYRFASRTYSPPAGYSVGSRNCFRKTYPYSRQVQEYPWVSKIYTHGQIGSSYTTQTSQSLVQLV